ncbi:MAG: DNA mismatch repair endonuclease MutL [Bryobacteraceae bacterium]|nr:DNA mismatch repair endonuclease MutL [Bryobacteraceae bacterium]MDW8380175.1 DNA mismatch repair endonuclease MutL [Bryobacterales bacterium]
MGRIQILPDELANKIAAGEVVERPASVVKELLENSIDAGATELRIEVEAGGRRLIRVADNGSGLLRDDALLAFERHATSKIRQTRDLFAIKTLGFRGEALPSIASVSRLTLDTQSVEEPVGSHVEIAGGKILLYEEAALPPGTTVTVRDLFFNVPARRKFLRSEQTELAHIASLVTHYSLAHPDKSFELEHNHNQLLQVTPVATLRERVYQVFGARLLEELVEIEGVRRELPAEADEAIASSFIELKGFISRPQFQKTNRNSIFLFVNQRLIRDKLLMHALSAAYQNLMPPHAFPFALLFLRCGAEEVDVNVHPSKTEIRFRRASFVHDFVKDALSEALSRSRPASTLPLRDRPQPAAELPYSEFSQALENQRFQDAPAPETALSPEQLAELPEFVLKPHQSPAPRLAFGDAAIDLAPSGSDAGFQREQHSINPAPLRLRAPDTHGSFPQEAILDAPASMEALKDLRPLGQLQDSFLIAASRDGLWIIDQHVAHERILFEKVLRQRLHGKVEMQNLLLPLILELTPGQMVQYERIREELLASGFDTETFGLRTVAVKSAPATIRPSDTERLLQDILEIAEGDLRQVSLEDLQRGIAASIACRAAIKINTKLEPAKIDYLIRELAQTEYPMSCPHGRPVALRYSIRDILRGFHRI